MSLIIKIHSDKYGTNNKPITHSNLVGYSKIDEFPIFKFKDRTELYSKIDMNIPDNGMPFLVI